MKTISPFNIGKSTGPNNTPRMILKLRKNYLLD